MSSPGIKSDEDSFVTLWVGKGKMLDREGKSGPETNMETKVLL